MGNSTIRKLTPVGTNWVVSTIAGLAQNSGTADGSNSVARFRYPFGVAVDGVGNVYVADQGNHAIRRLAPVGTNWVVSTIAGLAGIGGSADGTNNTARFTTPDGVAVDGSGNVYVADTGNNTIRLLSPSGVNWVVTTIAGLTNHAGSADGMGSNARFNNPTGVAVDGKFNVYVADDGNNTIRRLNQEGTNWVVFTVAGLAGNSGSVDGVGSAVRFNGPYGVAVDNNTNVFVADSINDTIRGVPLPGVGTAALIKMMKSEGDGRLMLVWKATVGSTYQVQYKTDLNQPVWSNYTSITASSWTGVTPLPVGTDPQRFYRVIIP